MRAGSERFPKANPVSVGGLMKPVGEKIGCGSKILLDTLKKDWGTIVGDSNARNSAPMTFDDGVLTIAVSSPVWMTQVRFMKTSFLEKINLSLAARGMEVRDIQFTMNPGKEE